MIRSPHRLLFAVALGALGAIGVASASDLGKYDALFPTNPCQDGWVACLDEVGDEVNPGPLTDKVGRPVPSSSRLGWFDLKPTAGFSPFITLSEYPEDGELPPKAGEAVAEADTSQMAEEIARIEAERKSIQEERNSIQEERKASQENVQAQEEAVKKAQEDAARLAKQQEEQRRKDEAARKARAAEEAAALADARSRSAEDAARVEAEQARARAAAEEERKAREAEAERQRQEAERKAKEQADRLAADQEAARKAEEDRKKREEETARKAEEAARKAEEATQAAAEAEERRKQEEVDRARKAEEDAAKAAAMAEADKDCSDLVAMESGALMGKLREGQIGCLETAYAGAASQTDKNKVSRVLMVNAEASGDRASWEQLVTRHLEEVDRSDPDLCYSFALYLSKGGVGRAWGVIKWADYALENKSRWTGSTYKSRVYSLMQLKAQAAASLWEYSAQAVVSGEGDRAKLQEDEKKMRGLAKDYALEWLDYARASKQDDRTAMALCVSAAGSKKFCEGG